MEEKENFSMKIEKHENRNLIKLAKAFGDGLNLQQLHPPKTPQERPQTAKEDFCVPKVGPNTQTLNPGRPIDLNTAKALRATILGYASQSFTSDWKKFFFSFREPKCNIPYGMDATYPGPRALTLCVQAHVLRSLMFSEENTKEEVYFGKASPKPTKIEQENALVDAFVEILWNVAAPVSRQNKQSSGDRRQVIITLVGYEQCFQTKRTFVEDGFTEKIWLYSMNTKLEVRKFIRRNIHYFCGRLYPGGIMLLYSIVLSRTIDVIMKEMGKRQTALLTENARSTQALVALLLTGSSVPHLHNGIMRYDDHGRALQHPLTGLKSRSEIGFLFFNKHERDNERTQVGSMYKTPLVPIWLTQVNGSYGIMFCTSRDLVTDWKTERYFCLHYYNGHFTQINETLLTLDTRTRVDSINPDKQISIWDDEEEKEKKQPSLENLIYTKWPQAEVDWNGETPYY